MTAQTAHVDVLTAEVRVLMVGSRQVTLSVARQLDYVNLSQIEPFGRVKLGDGEQVIGRSCRDGTLVLARFTQHPGHVTYINDDDLSPDLDTKPVVCDKMSTFGGYFNLCYGDKPIRLSSSAANRCGKHPYTTHGECEHWQPMGHDDFIRKAIEAHDDWVAENCRMAGLPLIVLAGLR